MVDKPKILSSYEIHSVHTPEVSSHTIEHVICVFGLVLDLVLVFVGFGSRFALPVRGTPKISAAPQSSAASPLPSLRSALPSRCSALPCAPNCTTLSRTSNYTGLYTPPHRRSAGP